MASHNCPTNVAAVVAVVVIAGLCSGSARYSRGIECRHEESAALLGFGGALREE